MLLSPNDVSGSEENLRRREDEVLFWLVGQTDLPKLLRTEYLERFTAILASDNVLPL